MPVYRVTGTKGVKAETLAIRLPSKFKFGIELLARKQQKTISDVVLEAVEGVLKEQLTAVENGERHYLPDLLWDPITADRLVNIALHEPGLLSDDEQVLWKVISEDKKYWSKAKKPRYDEIRLNWKKIQGDAEKIMKAFE